MALLTLALGIGATTALFSVVYGVLISPYPYARPGEIWAPGLRTANSNQRMRPYRPDEFREMAKLPVFSDVMATGPARTLLTGDFAPESISGIRVSGNAFQFLGVPPLFGRTIQPSDIQPSGEPESVTVLSFKRWQKLFGTDTNILGKTLRLDDQTYTIVGVMPPRFVWWTDDGVWVPLGQNPRDLSRVFPIARLKPGVSATTAQEQLHALHAMQQVELGFRPEHVMVMDLSLPPNRYPTWEQRNQFARELLQHAETLPGVEAATVGNGGLPFDTDQLNYVIEGHDDSQKREMTVNFVAAGYLRTMRIPLKRGRMVSEQEVNASQPVNLSRPNLDALQNSYSGSNP